MKLKSKLFVLLLLLAAAVTFTFSPTIAQQSNTTLIVNWTVPGVISAQDLTAQVLASINGPDTKFNKSSLDVFSRACADWTVNADRYRALGMSIPAKPVQPPMMISTPVVVSSVSPVQIRITTSLGPALLGAPCPDLAPLGVAQPNHFVLGPQQQQAPGVFAAGYGDTVPNGQIVADPPGCILVTSSCHRYQKQTTPFGGYYYQLQ